VVANKLGIPGASDNPPYPFREFGAGKTSFNMQTISAIFQGEVITAGFGKIEII
jgi:hypothetical protein